MIISILVTNNTNVYGTFKVTLKVNGVVETSGVLCMSAGSTYRQTFYITKKTPGTYKVDFQDLTGSFVVKVR